VALAGLREGVGNEGYGRYQRGGCKNSETHNVFPSLVLTARQITTDRAFHFLDIFRVVAELPTLGLTGFAEAVHKGSLAYRRRIFVAENGGERATY
jgi:hypothetical protein